MSNRLARETSPYLLQHKDNPVDWYPWGEEALERARTEDRPVLLSVGYAACHWCHVMEHESFEDPETAALMNEHYVCIKVDREERPDIDAIYMDAVQAMTGQGGWPMTVFLTPEGTPFFGGTYFPPDDRHGLPSFKRLLVAVAETWRDRRDEVHTQGKKLVAVMDPLAGLSPSSDPIGNTILDEAFAAMSSSYDRDYGGFGGSPKFPQPMTFDLLMRMAGRHQPRAAEMVDHSLDAMAAGGMFDQLGGGFHRYSVDRYWLVPHFEKMLYDNAQLLRTYARWWSINKKARHRDVAEMTARWMLDEMRDPGGGFWSSLDADSEGVEGKFYVWSWNEIQDILGPHAEQAAALWGFTPDGNFEGTNIPVWGSGDGEARETTRRALLAARESRTRPGTDDKVLTSWNAMTAAALAEAGTLLERPEWIGVAVEAMDFILTEMRLDGRLMRAYRDGRVNHLGVAEDYAHVLEACVALHQATLDLRWLDAAREIADEGLALFEDPDRGGFFISAADAEPLIARTKDLIDNATPAANSVFAFELQRLAAVTGETSYEDHAVSAMRLVVAPATRSPLGFAFLLAAVDRYLSDGREIVIAGDPDAAATLELLTFARPSFPSDDVLSLGPPDGSGRWPLLQGRSTIDGHAAAYVCRHGVCDLPVTTSEDLARVLSSR